MKYTSKSFCLILFIHLIGSIFSHNIFGQINPENVEIIRDAYGVPHIYGRTDADTAYGLAWAHAEDDFLTIQKAYLAGNGQLSQWKGKGGVGADFLTQFINSKETVLNLYDTISEEFKAVLHGYAEGLNAYAKHHPEEVILSSFFPITPQKILIYSQLQLFVYAYLLMLCLPE